LAASCGLFLIVKHITTTGREARIMAASSAINPEGIAMKVIITSGVIVLTVLAAPVYAQGGAEPHVPPPAGGQIEPAPPETSGDVLNVPQAAAREELLQGTAVRAVFTSEIEDREPVDQLSRVNAGSDKIYFFTELKDLEGQTVKHRWLYKGELVAEVAFNVNGSRWRVWSSKTLQPDQLGTWTVEVVNGSGDVIASSVIEHEQAPGETPPVPLASEPATDVAAQQ
jgi:hypothetical protein